MQRNQHKYNVKKELHWWSTEILLKQNIWYSFRYFIDTDRRRRRFD